MHIMLPISSRGSQTIQYESFFQKKKESGLPYTQYNSFIQAHSFFVYITARLCSAYSSGLVTGDLCDAACGVDSSSSSNNNNNHLDSVSCLGNHYGKHLVFSAELEGKEVGKRICINSIFISVLYAESPPSLSRWWSRARGATASAATPT